MVFLLLCLDFVLRAAENLGWRPKGRHYKTVAAGLTPPLIVPA